VLGDLLNQIPQEKQIDSLYTDGTYDTKYCRQVISEHQAHGLISSKKNAKPLQEIGIFRKK